MKGKPKRQSITLLVYRNLPWLHAIMWCNTTLLLPHPLLCYHVLLADGNAGTVQLHCKSRSLWCKLPSPIELTLGILTSQRVILLLWVCSAIYMSILSRWHPFSWLSTSSNTDFPTLPCSLNPSSLCSFLCESKLEIFSGYYVLFQSHQAITVPKGSNPLQLLVKSPSVRQTPYVISSHCFSSLAAVTNRPFQIWRL